jgi:hypothetical protein
MRGHAISGLALLAVLLCAPAARADEIRLKDGTKITGTIVGFEDGSFRVETSFGFALIQKDKVADINITAAKKEPEPKPKSTTPPAPPSAPPPAMVPAVAKEPAAGASIVANAPAPARTTPAKNDAPLPKPKTVAEAAPTPPPAPPPTPEPVVIRDEIRGNLYVNLTYGFQMYKPPSWDLIPDARKALPDAVAALGTNDQTTLLVIGREHTKDSLDAHAAGTGKTLSAVYDNYRLISNQHVAVAGFPAIEQRSRGTADGHDWSVVLVTFLRGNDAYTLLGMTWADSDLIQLQENVISKTINSLTFTAQ